ncbi:undecaprenyl diphosphate synthase family protein [Kribbella sp. NPDC051952]|uniref:undecaprenyl diphosphate synthase family protein n=1 Tax=Kribbella sp. NPDC051952 TaxID=3154851 RepID=UPI003421165B
MSRSPWTATAAGLAAPGTTTVLADHVRRDPGWRLHVAGQLDLLPDATARALKDAVEESRDRIGVGELTIAIGYSGRGEVLDAVRELLAEAAEAGRSPEEVAAELSEDDIRRTCTCRICPTRSRALRTYGRRKLDRSS